MQIQNDVRFDVARLYRAVPDEADGVGSVVSESGEPGFSRNEAAVRLITSVRANPHVSFVGDIELIWLQRSERELSLADLTLRSGMDPWRIECDAAYVDIRDILPGLDARIGRQIVQWGSADLFNPTSLLNADDLEDRTLFREPIASEMIRLDYTYLPEREGWLSEISLTFVWVPIFRPAQLPGSAMLPIRDASEEIPVVEDDVRGQIERLRGLVRGLLDDPDVHAEVPELSLDDSQVGARVQVRMGETDFSLTYFRGNDDIPVFRRADAFVNDPDGSPTIGSNVTLAYPRMQALGFDMSGQVPFLDDMGFWLEGAVMFPERMPLTFAFPPLPPILPTETVFEGSSVLDRPFLKLTVGLDYSFNQYFFLLVQFIHGMINEFGAGNMSNILLAGLDVKLWSDRILLRLFGLIQLDFLDEAISGQPFGDWEDQLSGNLFPMLRLNPWGNLDFDLGAVIPLGSRGSYFGQPATGTTEVFLRARASF